MDDRTCVRGHLYVSLWSRVGSKEEESIGMGRTEKVRLLDGFGFFN